MILSKLELLICHGSYAFYAQVSRNASKVGFGEPHKIPPIISAAGAGNKERAVMWTTFPVDRER